MRNKTFCKFSSQADPEILNKLRKIANIEGRKIQSILDEAFRDYLSKKETSKSKPKINKALTQSLQEFNQLYKNLTKL